MNNIFEYSNLFHSTDANGSYTIKTNLLTDIHVTEEVLQTVLFGETISVAENIRTWSERSASKLKAGMSRMCSRRMKVGFWTTLRRFDQAIRGSKYSFRAPASRSSWRSSCSAGKFLKGYRII